MMQSMRDGRYDQFRKSFLGTPELLAYLDANFSDDDTGALNELLESIDESNFSAHAWTEALIVFERWLRKESLDLPITDQIAYICCSVESVKAGGNLEHLPAVVMEMLEQYGCANAVKRSAED